MSEVKVDEDIMALAHEVEEGGAEFQDLGSMAAELARGDEDLDIGDLAERCQRAGAEILALAANTQALVLEVERLARERGVTILVRTEGTWPPEAEEAA